MEVNHNTEVYTRVGTLDGVQRNGKTEVNFLAKKTAGETLKENGLVVLDFAEGEEFDLKGYDKKGDNGVYQKSITVAGVKGTEFSRVIAAKDGNKDVKYRVITRNFEDGRIEKRMYQIEDPVSINGVDLPRTTVEETNTVSSKKSAGFGPLGGTQSDVVEKVLGDKTRTEWNSCNPPQGQNMAGYKALGTDENGVVTCYSKDYTYKDKDGVEHKGTEYVKFLKTKDATGKEIFVKAVNHGTSDTSNVRTISVIDVKSKPITAYDIAVDHGFKGTEAEWLKSLKGKDGKPGDSAYDVAVKNGFEGTEKEWLESLKGAKGDRGSSGGTGATGQNGSTPTIGDNGNWFINGQDTGVKAEGVDGQDGKDANIPTIGDNGNWFIGDVDTGKPSQGADGQNGSTPTIGDNGNWFIGGVDTGKPAQGKDGETIIPEIGSNGNWFIDGVDTGQKAQGPQGEPGQNGQDGQDGQDGKDCTCDHDHGPGCNPGDEVPTDGSGSGGTGTDITIDDPDKKIIP